MSEFRKLVDLLAHHAYEEGDFRLSSGRSSSFYLDAKQITYHPDGVALVGEAVVRLATPFDVEAVGGLTMGADAIISSTVWASRNTDHPLPGFVVRKEPKPHGLQKWIEGIAPHDRRVVIVDDVVTSGGSVLQAVDAARSAGATVAVVVALVDREEGGASALEAADIPFRAICTVSEIREAWRSLKSVVA